MTPLDRLAALAVPDAGRVVTPADRVALDACRLLGHDRPSRRAPTAELLIEGEYALARLVELADDPDADQVRAYFYGVLDGLAEEAARRLRRPIDPQRMPSRIDQAALDRIREEAPCHEFVQWGGTVDLQPIPRYRPVRWLGLCPFHHEKTPSFTVTTRVFYCHGCHVGGDVFEYARLRAGLETGSFVEAVRIVAAYAGIDPTPRSDILALDKEP